MLSYDQRVFLIVMIIFYFFLVGSDASFHPYLTTFSVKSRLNLSKKVGAEITGTFWGCFATMRFVNIFATIYLKPIYIMCASCLVSCIGSILLMICGNESGTGLWVGSAMFGLGIASIWPTGMLWIKSHMKITNRIGKFFPYFS